MNKVKVSVVVPVYKVEKYLERCVNSIIKQSLSELYTVLARPIKDVIKERHFLLAVARLYAKYKAKVFDKKRNIQKVEWQ